MLKKIFQKRTPAYDKEALWLEIEKKLDKKKKRRFFLLWFIGFSSLTISIWLGQQTIKTYHKNSLSIDKNENVSKTNANAIHKIHQHNPLLKTIESNTKDKNKEHEKATYLKSESKAMASNDGTHTYQFSEKPANGEPVKIDNRYHSFRGNNEPDLWHAERTKTDVVNMHNSNLNEFLYSRTDSQMAVINLPKLEDAKISIEPLPILNVHVWMKSTNPFVTTELIIDRHQNPRSFWSMDLHSGYQNTKRKISNKGLNDAYYNFKLKSERPAENIFGMVLLKYYTGQFSIGSGIQYQRFTEWFNAVEVITKTTLIPSDSASYYNTPSGLVYEPGVLIANEITRRTINSPNYITRINIPIEVGYRHSFGKTLSINGNLGLFWNIFSRRRGINIDEELIFFYHDGSKFKSIYRANNVNSLYAGIMVNKQLSKHWHVGLGGSFQKDFTSIYYQQLESRYSFWGLELGLGYRL